MRRRPVRQRQHPRGPPYIAGLRATRCNPACKALVAVMRKLVTLLDALLRADRMWQPEPAAS